MNKSCIEATSVAFMLIGIAIVPVSALAQAIDVTTGTSVVEPPPPNGSSAETAVEEEADPESLAWEAVRHSGTTSDIIDFMETYPNGLHVKDATVLLLDLLAIDTVDYPQSPVTGETTTAETPSIGAVAEDEGVEARQIPDIATEEVELRSSDGFVSLTGTIIDFDDAIITIETSSGIIGIETDGIACTGVACPGKLLATP